MNEVMVVAILIAVPAIYFAPAIIGFARKHHQRGAILILNLFLGWTFLGWVAALIWSFTAIREPVAGTAPNKPPGERIEPAAPDISPAQKFLEKS